MPRDFFCELGVSKSRVFALVSGGDRPESLQAILTCKDPVLATRIAELLRRALEGGSGPALDVETDRIAARLPDAPAASLRQAVEHAYAGTWYDVPELEVALPLSDPFWAGGDRPGERDALARTPFGARLADLNGEVVRIFHMYELHIHDAGKLARAAASLGGGDSPSDPDLDPTAFSLFHFTRAHVSGNASIRRSCIPGTDLVNEETVVHRLSTANGDELAEWSTEPITECFETGTPVSDDH